MTFAEETGDKTLLEEREYPSAFGITFTPLNSGIGLGVLGILGAIYIWMTFGAPNYDKYNQLKAQETEKEQQLATEKNGNYQSKLTQVEQEISQAKKLQTTAYSLFANESSADTLLLDLNRLVRIRQATLSSFTPDNKAVVVSDGSLGLLVNNKLKRTTFNLDVQGDFLKVHELMRDVERLQPLLLVKNFKAVAALPEAQPTNIIKTQYKDGKIIYEQGKNSQVKTTFRLDLIFPLSPDEMAKLNPPAPAASPPPAEPAKK